MSTINNFLKIRIFNLEQNIKSKASERIKDIDKKITEIESIEEHLKDIKFSNKETVFINLAAYKGALQQIRYEEGNLFNYIERYYSLSTPSEPKTKSKATKSRKKKE